MSEVIDFKQFKDDKFNKKIVEDIDSILKVLSLAQQGLAHFKYYAPVQEIISVMETNKTLFEFHRKKYEQAILQKT